MGPPNYECRLGRGRAQLHAKIKPQNDRPIFALRRETWLPFQQLVPENVSDVEAKCIKVGVLTKMSLEFIERIKQNKEARNITGAKLLAQDLTPQTVVIDPDSPAVGLAVLMAPKQKFGRWEYQIKGGPRHEINLTSGMVLLLKPDDCISFRANKGAFWSKANSIDFTFIRVRAWDCSDHMSSGYKALNSSVMNTQTSFSLKHVKFVAFKLGCDNVAGSNKTRDLCGQCPKRGVKKDSCLGCDGVPNSKHEKGKENYLEPKD